MNYAISSYKPIYLSPRCLSELEEARGRLVRVFQSEGQTIAAFEWGDLTLPLEIFDGLLPLVGREIAILRLNGRHYLRRGGDA